MIFLVFLVMPYLFKPYTKSKNKPFCQNKLKLNDILSNNLINLLQMNVFVPAS